MTSTQRLIWFAASLGFAAMLLLLWELASRAGVVRPVFFPAPSRIAAALAEGLTDGSLLRNTALTVARTLGGWLIASVIGAALGALIGMSDKANSWLGPMLEALRPLPVAALVPIIVAVFGYTEQMVLAIIAFGALWPCLMSTVSGFRAVEPRLYEVARVLQMGRAAVLFRIALPSALPEILAGMRVGLTVALILVVVGEIMASRPGVGFLILLAQRSFQSADLYAGILVLGLVGLVTAALLDSIEKRLVFWR
ncbi:ABC transporter permease [Maritimibacter sp. DP1N21-5]|uniref:ABC transporter permease n=1 Tax=Maritimibacter sp. DP1N21-5 TaxID=2836867 RepID=UPI001C441640|nr:ABC transporter permease [Maritimibacter sp. DP1N21-5]MBV7408530.1 ABC transporter permease [Maritimibacter sp. DP1N21-5]